MTYVELLSSLVVRFGVNVKYFLATIAAIWLSIPALAQEVVQFESEVKRPLKVAIFQEIPGFRSSLYSLDQITGLIDKSDEWVPMVDADIWVFNLKSGADAVMLPEFLLEVLEERYDDKPTFSVAANVAFNDKPLQRLMFFSFVEDFGENELETIGCETATVLYFQLKGSELRDGHTPLEDCYSK